MKENITIKIYIFKLKSHPKVYTDYINIDLEYVVDENRTGHYDEYSLNAISKHNLLHSIYQKYQNCDIDTSEIKIGYIKYGVEVDRPTHISITNENVFNTYLIKERNDTINKILSI